MKKFWNESPLHRLLIGFILLLIGVWIGPILYHITDTCSIAINDNCTPAWWDLALFYTVQMPFALVGLAITLNELFDYFDGGGN